MRQASDKIRSRDVNPCCDKMMPWHPGLGATAAKIQQAMNYREQHINTIINIAYVMIEARWE